MFDGELPEASELATLDAAALIDAARGWARTENAATARKLAVLAEIFTRRTALPTADERESWFVDPDAAVAAELAAALEVTHGLALHQTYRAVALRDRLPEVAALFAAGLVSDLVIRKIIWRTGLITDPDTMAAVDAVLAERVSRWGRLSEKKLEAAIDATVIAHDSVAQRRARSALSNRSVQFGSPGDEVGFTTIWARMFDPDAALMQDRVEAIARSVCEADPRGWEERLVDAFAAVGAGLDALACRCGTEDCEAAGRGAPVRNTTIYVLTDSDTLDATQAATAERPGPDTPPEREPAEPKPEPRPAEPEPVDIESQPAEPEPNSAECELAAEQESESFALESASVAASARFAAGEAEETVQAEPEQQTVAELADAPAPASIAKRKPAESELDEPRELVAKPAFVFGSGVLPSVLLGPLLDRARIRLVTHPGATPPERRYLPSAALTEFVRCRDLTCRFPGCDRPATDADIDHTVPYPVGPTHASNLKCLCRFHHLVKTFWSGPDGWRDRQLPDGTVIWTSPTGHTYRTYPGSRLLFPTLCRPTGTLWTGDPPELHLSDGRGVMMPRRRRTRADNRARAIAAQRRLNTELIHADQEAVNNPLAECDDRWTDHKQRPPCDPPPF